MYWLVDVDTDDGGYRCVVYSSSEYYAEKKARMYYRDEGLEVYSADARMFNTFEDGDVRDYTIVD